MHRLRAVRTLTAILSILTVVAAAACGGGGDDSPTGPTADFSAVGDWSFEVRNATGDGATCDQTGWTITFTQSGSSNLTGRIDAGSNTRTTCVINGQSSSSTVSGATTLTSVTRSGSSITFSWVGSAGLSTMTGTIQNNNRMSGTATIHVRFTSGTTRDLAGTWTATRQ